MMMKILRYHNNGFCKESGVGYRGPVSSFLFHTVYGDIHGPIDTTGYHGRGHVPLREIRILLYKEDEG